MKGLAAVLLGLVLGSCSSSSKDNGPDPQALCKEGTASICEKIYTCTETIALRTFLGATSADCQNTLNAQQCATATCDPGLTYHPDMAQACLDTVKALSCADLASASAEIYPAVCQMICTAA